MTKKWFIRKHANRKGDQVNQSWLHYSPVKEATFCFCCPLFSSSSDNSKSSFESEIGFRHWKKTKKWETHEISVFHRRSFCSWMEHGLISGCTVYAALHIQSDKQSGERF
mgnify:CR=1 FL=1